MGQTPVTALFMGVNLTRFYSFMQSGRRSRPSQVIPTGLGSSTALFGSHYNKLLRVQPKFQTKKSHGRAQVAATARPMDVDINDATNLVEVDVNWFDAFCRFTRPHTIYGSALGVISVSLLAVQSPADFTSTFFVGLLQVLTVIFVCLDQSNSEIQY